MAEDTITTTGIARHGATRLPSVEVDSFNIEMKYDEGFLGDRASKGAFRKILDSLRKPLKKNGDDPLGKKSTSEIAKTELDEALVGDDVGAAALVHGAIEEFAQELAYVTRRFLKTKAWPVPSASWLAEAGSRAGRRTRDARKHHSQGRGFRVDLVPIRFHPDAGLIGTLHLTPSLNIEAMTALSRSISAAPISAAAWWRHAGRRR
jgi:hypothetical protein